jgi:Helix-turn-helix domain of resolvase
MLTTSGWRGASPLAPTGTTGLKPSGDSRPRHKEPDSTSLRLKAVIALARSQGKPHGRPITVAAHADEIRDLVAQGVDKREIAKRFDISRTSVRRLIS